MIKENWSDVMGSYKKFPPSIPFSTVMKRDSLQPIVHKYIDLDSVNAFCHEMVHFDSSKHVVI